MDSLKEFQDRGGEVCIVDTGSTDNTVEVAKSRGCIVKEVGEKYIHIISKEQAKEINDRFIVENEMPIVNEGDKYFDFAGARNDVVSIASSDWVCTVDCDEMLTKLDIDRIDEIIKDPNLGHLEYNFVFSHMPDGSELIKFVQSKFYNRAKMNWVGIIHEMVTPLPGQICGVGFMDESIFKLEHWQNPETNRGGYLRGLAVDCFEHQEKDRNSHYFARELWWNGRPWSAAKEFKRHIEMRAWPAERAESMLFLADIYGAMEKPEEQIEWAMKALATDPGRREPLIKLAQIYARHGEWTPANFYATAALELPWSGYYGSNKRFYENEPHELLYQAKGWLGDIAGAQKHLLIALEYQRENPAYLRDTQFYFDYAANSIPGWMSFKEQLFLHDTANKMESVIELGSWKGKSTHALCSSKCASVTAVDHWQGSKDEASAHEQAKDGSVFKEFKDNVGHFKNLKIVKKDINEAVKDLESADMVFIDAGHTYEEVKNDIRKWKSKAKILLCGHDYTVAWAGVKQAVDEELGGPDEVYDTIWVKWLVKPLVSICVPTLGRPDKLNRLLVAIKENAEYDNYEVIVKADELPPNNIGAPKMLKKCVDESKGDLICFLGNDVVPEPGFLREAVWEMARRFPEMDGMIGFNDSYWKSEHVAPHFLISKKLLPVLDGEIFHTGYNHTGCDNELRARVEKLGKYAWAEKAKIFHDHPMMSGSKADMDALYEQAYNGPRHDADNKLYAERALKFGFADRKWA
jgi:glycosyltransferase involved in cell wall biosynthesis